MSLIMSQQRLMHCSLEEDVEADTHLQLSKVCREHVNHCKPGEGS